MIRIFHFPPTRAKASPTGHFSSQGHTALQVFTSSISLYHFLF
jgi:hypothetical protein